MDLDSTKINQVLVGKPEATYG